MQRALVLTTESSHPRSSSCPPHTQSIFHCVQDLRLKGAQDNNDFHIYFFLGKSFPTLLLCSSETWCLSVIFMTTESKRFLYMYYSEYTWLGLVVWVCNPAQKTEAGGYQVQDSVTLLNFSQYWELNLGSGGISGKCYHWATPHPRHIPHCFVGQGVDSQDLIMLPRLISLGSSNPPASASWVASGRYHHPCSKVLHTGRTLKGGILVSFVNLIQPSHQKRRDRVSLR